MAESLAWTSGPVGQPANGAASNFLYLLRTL
jgi:hypothetical protein